MKLVNLILKLELNKMNVTRLSSCTKIRPAYSLFPNQAFFFKLAYTPCKAEQPLRGMELQEKQHKKDYRIQKICLERIYF